MHKRINPGTVLAGCVLTLMSGLMLLLAIWPDTPAPEETAAASVSLESTRGEG